MDYGKITLNDSKANEAVFLPKELDHFKFTVFICNSESPLLFFIPFRTFNVLYGHVQSFFHHYTHYFQPVNVDPTLVICYLNEVPLESEFLFSESP